MDTEELVAVYSTTHEADAELMRSRLQDAGIDAQVSGKNQGGFAGVLDVQVLVRASDEAAAREIVGAE